MLNRTKDIKKDKDNIQQEYVDEEGKPIQTVPMYNLTEKILLSINVDKSMIVTLYDTTQGKFIEFKKCWKGYPTKSFIRISYNSFEEIYNIIKKKDI